MNVDIQNQGDQIPQERLGDIFEKFIRLDKARLSDTGGTGLGAFYRGRDYSTSRRGNHS